MKISNIPIAYSGKPLRVVFWGYHNSGLITYQFLRESNLFDLVAIVLPNNRVHESIEYLQVDAERSGVTVLKPTNLKANGFARTLQDLHPDMFMVDSYSRLIPKTIIDIVGDLGFNLHPGILPQYRGAHVLNWALINGEKETGFSLHMLTANFDEGPVIACEKIKIHRQDDINAIDTKLMQKIPALLKVLETQMKSNCIKAFEQSGRVHHYPARKPADGKIEIQDHSQHVFNKVRALTYPWPGAYFECSQKKIIVWKCIQSQVRLKAKTGSLVRYRGEVYYMAADNKPVLLKTINTPQQSDHSPVTGKDIFRALRENGIQVCEHDA